VSRRLIVRPEAEAEMAEAFFVEDDQRVVVLSVFHAKRNPKRWQERI
jgi:hypothetical protein